MANIVVGCDRNNGNDSDFRDTVASMLEQKGHSVEKLDIGPNNFAAYSYDSGRASGKIGVFMIAAGLTAICDLYDGNTSFKYAYFGIRGDVGNGIASMEDFKTKGIHKDRHGDCISKSCNPFDGKTYPQINEETKSKCQCVYGGNPKEMGNNIIKAMGGEALTDDGGGSTGSTIKDALKKAVSGWDGEAEIRIIEDTVYVNKIHDPTETDLVINEFDNVQYDSVTITDVNPQTINKLTMSYEGQDLTLQDDLLITRFEEHAETIEPDEFVKSKKDAIAFLQRNWNKIRRDDGRQVELKVDGDNKWKVGLWARVYLPSFFIDDYMYITRLSADEDGTGNWVTSLTLVDYPPSFGTFEEESTDTEDTEEVDETALEDAEASTEEALNG